MRRISMPRCKRLTDWGAEAVVVHLGDRRARAIFATERSS